MDHRQFYSEIGKLIYAVTDIDGVISQTEKKAISEVVKKELAPMGVPKGSGNMDLSHYAEIEFDFLENEIADAEAAFESFIDFIEDHKTAIDERMLNASEKLAKKLASAYYGTNKKEKALIERLSKKIRSIQKERNLKVTQTSK